MDGIHDDSILNSMAYLNNLFDDIGLPRYTNKVRPETTEYLIKLIEQNGGQISTNEIEKAAGQFSDGYVKGWKNCIKFMRLHIWSEGLRVRG